MRPVLLSLAAAVALTTSCASPPPGREPLTSEQSPDGLYRVDTRRVAGAWLKPDAELGEYARVRILEPYVAFEKEWRRRHREVRDRDVERIRTALARLFLEVFERELRRGGYVVVDENAADVLLLRPALIDLDVSAPDVFDPSRRVITSNAGAMTLVLELYDSVAGEILARLIDRRAAGTGSVAHVGGAVSNRVEAERLLARWARLLVERLKVHRFPPPG